MAEVVVSVNARSYTLTCGEGEEERIRRLAQYVDRKVGEFASNLGRGGEARLLLLAALVIADELAEAQAQIATSGRQNPAAEGPDVVERAADSLLGLAQRLEAIAARLESP